MDRFKSIVTQDQNYVQELIRYVHLNPVRAGICENIDALADYTWSGHSVLMGKVRRNFQDTETVLRRFGTDNASARVQYCRFLQAGLTGSSDEDTFAAGHSAIEGQYQGENFAITVRTRAKSMAKVIAGSGPGDNQCGIGGEKVALKGANIRALYQYSKMLNWMEKKGFLRYNAVIANCSFYTFLGMNLAGVNNIYGIIPDLQYLQMAITKGWGY